MVWCAWTAKGSESREFMCTWDLGGHCKVFPSSILSLTELLNSNAQLLAFWLTHNSPDKEWLLLTCLAPRLNETFVGTYIVR